MLKTTLAETERRLQERGCGRLWWERAICKHAKEAMQTLSQGAGGRLGGVWGRCLPPSRGAQGPGSQKQGAGFLLEMQRFEVQRQLRPEFRLNIYPGASLHPTLRVGRRGGHSAGFILY